MCKNGLKSKPIKTLKSLSLRVSGMRLTEIFEIEVDGETATICYYRLNYRDGEEKKELISQKAIPATEAVDFLNQINVGAWDGFYGEHPKYVTDGEMFLLKADVDGKTIRAEGSQNFPPHYYDLKNWFYNLTR